MLEVYTMTERNRENEGKLLRDKTLYKIQNGA